MQADPHIEGATPRKPLWDEIPREDSKPPRLSSPNYRPIAHGEEHDSYKVVAESSSLSRSTMNKEERKV